MGFTPEEAASPGIIGGAAGPKAIFGPLRLALHLLGPIAIAAYSYRTLVPAIIPWASNIAGVIGSAVAVGVLISFLG